jgi:hypothetical protein
MKNLKNAFPFLLFIFFTFNSFGQKEVKQIEPTDIVGVYSNEILSPKGFNSFNPFTGLVEFTPSGYMYIFDENGETIGSYTYTLTAKTITTTFLNEGITDPTRMSDFTETEIWRKTKNGFETRRKNTKGYIIHNVYTKIKKSSEEWE